MQADKILNGIKLEKSNERLLRSEISSISADSREVKEGALFFAYKGFDYDSHKVAVQLYQEGKIKGAVCEHALDIPCVVVSNGREAFAKACANWFDNPQDKLYIMGLTGTNGKTTTTWLIESIFNEAGLPCIRIGTTGAKVGDKHYELENTTPSPYDFFYLLSEGVHNGAKTAVAEVSSHALEQGRLAGIVFDAAVFTNLTGDHLDYHKDLESYYQAKKSLFQSENSRKKIINVTNDFGKRLYEETEGEKLSFGFKNTDISAENHTFTSQGTDAVIKYKNSIFTIKSPLVGEFNLENILGAVGVAISAGIGTDQIVEGIAKLKNVPGRLEKYSSKGVTVFVDYAHTDDALKNVLEAVKQIAKGRLITVFGAGGDRDKTKRPRMGKVAQMYSDLSVVTSDNPRREDPESIIKEITVAMKVDETVHIEADRRKAIAYAVNTAKDGDIVVIAGKGHENYQIIGTTKYPFSDSKLAQEFLDLHNGREG